MKKIQDLSQKITVNPRYVASWIGCWKLKLMHPLIRVGAYSDHYGLFIKSSKSKGVDSARYYIMISEYSIMAAVTSIFAGVTTHKNKKLAYDISSDYWCTIIQALQSLDRDEIKETLIQLNECDESSPVYGFPESAKNQGFQSVNGIAHGFETKSTFEIFCELTGFDPANFWMAVEVYKIICSFILSNSAISDNMVSRDMRYMIDMYISNVLVQVNESSNN